MDPQLMLTIAFCIIIALVAGVVLLSAASAPDPTSEAPGEPERRLLVVADEHCDPGARCSEIERRRAGAAPPSRATRSSPRGKRQGRRGTSGSRV
jgi:hypothetical protein